MRLMRPGLITLKPGKNGTAVIVVSKAGQAVRP
jgi:hypothetical protein